MQNAGNPKPVLCDNLDGVGKVVVGGFRRGHVYAYGQFMFIHDRGYHDIVK